MWIMLIYYYLLNVPPLPAHDDVKKWIKLLGKLQHIHRSNQAWCLWVGCVVTVTATLALKRWKCRLILRERRATGHQFLSSGPSCFCLPPAPVFLSLHSQFFPPCSRCLASVAVITHETPSSVCICTEVNALWCSLFLSRFVDMSHLKAPRSSLTP